MSYYKMMKKIEERLDAKSKSSKQAEFTGSGLLARSKLPAGSQKALPQDVVDELADYIQIIRKQKEEIVRGKT